MNDNVAGKCITAVLIALILSATTCTVSNNWIDAKYPATKDAKK